MVWGKEVVGSMGGGQGGGTAQWSRASWGGEDGVVRRQWDGVQGWSLGSVGDQEGAKGDGEVRGLRLVGVGIQLVEGMVV